MWAFVAVSLAICTPSIRTALEAMFAELTIVFLNWMTAVAVVTSVGFLGAIAVHVLAPKQLSSNGQRRVFQRGATVGRLVTSMLLASTFATAEARQLQEVSNKVPYTLADNKTLLADLQKLLTTCKYSKKKECINEPHKIPALGEWKRGPRQCTAFDAAYVTTTEAVAAIPNRYLPIGVEEAYEQGFRNRFSEWTEANQEQFQVDCPLLYNSTVAKGEDYLCCTESQYMQLKTQVRLIPGQCSTCKRNLRNVWCQMTCNPSNSEYIEPVQVRLMPGDEEHAGDVYPALEELNYFVGKDWIRDIYDFCQADQSFAILCSPLQNCFDGYGLLNFMGQYKFNNLGSPLQINVKTMDQLPAETQKEEFCACDSNVTDCYKPQDSRLETCVGVCGTVCSVSPNEVRTYTESCYGAKAASDDVKGNSTGGMDAKWDEFMSYMAENLERANFDVLNYFLAMFGGVVGVALILGFLYAICRGRKYAAASSSQLHAAATGNVFDERRLSAVDEWMATSLKRWGTFLATGKRPFLVSSIVLAVVIACSAGLTQIEVEITPVKLWVATSSRPYQERQRYAELFTPFYRTAQVVMIPKDKGVIARTAYLREAIRIQSVIANVTYGPSEGSFPSRVKLEDICWKATGTSCTVNSITQYFQNRLDHFDFYQKYDLADAHYAQCLYSPQNQDIQTCNALRSKLKDGDVVPETMSDCPCLSAFGSPMNLYNTYLGGFPAGAEENTTLFLESKAMLSTALIYNYYEDEANEPAINWEREFIKYLKQEVGENTLFDLYFNAEISVQDEIERESSGDMLPVILSYSLMIVYVSLGINRWKMKKSFFQTSKITVGFLGIVCIILAVSATIGIFMWCGVKLQLVIMEVVPFLTLAIGVDNIFLLVHAVEDKHALLRREQPGLFQNLNGDAKAIEQAAAVLVSEGVSYIGPSIFMASFAESIAFAFGCISPMPAVLWFAAFSCVAVAVNLVLQMTLLLTIITLDKRRELSGKYDLLYCVSVGAESSNDVEVPGQPLVVTEPKTPEESSADAGVYSSDGGSHLFDRCISAYTSFLALPLVKLLVLLVLLVFTLTSISSIENIEHGLPQAESMPSDSYLISYFNTIDEYLATGPPIYFVVEGGYGRNPKTFNLNDQSVEKLFCRSKDFCDEFSIPTIVDALANEMDSKVTHFATGVTYSWMDDFWSFVNPDSECCRVDSNTKSYLPIKSDDAAYTSKRKTNPTCLGASVSAPPVPQDLYMSLFSMFSTASAGSMCSYGGGSIYRGQFSVDEKPIPVLKSSSDQVVLGSSGFGSNISAFSYMVQSTSNPTQQDFIDLYAQGRRAAEWISEKTGVDVWVYSFFYVFFDQYLTVVADTYKLVGLSLLAIFLIHAAYFGSVFYPLVVALAATNIVIQVMGLMEPMGIMLNGLSMVNLIIAAGISVEFCGHYVRMFAKASGSGDERARTALRKVLTSVLFGITITKVVGLSALTLADSRIFQKYYFRMYMTVVVCGVLNGMVLLPVLLSVCVDVKEFLLRRKSAKQGLTGGDLEITSSPAAYQGVETAKQSPKSDSTAGSKSD